MHSESKEWMRLQVPLIPAGARVLDVGSADVNGTYRDLFDMSFTYIGLDVAPGPNVDLVALPPWPLTPESFDAVLCGQVLEHVEFPWMLMMEIASVLKPGGRAFVIAPARWPLHYHPYDTFRFHPDGMRALARWVGLEVEDTDILEHGPEFADCFAIMRKPPTSM